MFRNVSILVCLLLLTGFVYPQSQNAAGSNDETALDYETEEFPGWMLDLRRGEILFFGSLPITFFMTNQLMDFTRFFEDSFSEGRIVQNNAPWPFEDPNKEEYTENQIVMMVVGTVSLSLLVAVADYIIGRINGRDLGGY